MIMNNGWARAALAATLLAGAASLTPALAQSRQVVAVDKIRPTDADAHIARRVDIVQGKSIQIDLPRDAKEVFVASPEVANAVVRTPRRIYLIGVKAGSTSVLINDNDGRQMMAIDVGVSKELTREINIMRDVLKQAMPTANIELRGTGSNIVLSGTVDSMLDAQRAVDIANNLVGKAGGSIFSLDAGGSVVNALVVRGKDQVMLKVTVSEISRIALKQLGVNFNGQWTLGSKLFNLSLDNPFTAGRGFLSSTQIGQPATLDTAGLASNKVPLLRALERNGLSRTLAEPTLTAVSGESAKFLAGGEIPVPASEDCSRDSAGRLSCAIRYTYKPVGVTLNFTPVVMSENRISIRIATEVTELDPENQVNLNSGALSAFRTRRHETTVELPSGGVMATAGMIMQQSRQHINGLPALGNIPILGTLFRSRDFQRSETELMIVVQPYIAKPSKPDDIQLPDKNFATASDPSTIFMNRLVRTYGQGVNRPDPFRSGQVGFIND